MTAIQRTAHNTDNIPDTLKETGLFCVWKREQRDGNTTKVPFNPHTGGRAQSNNPGTFADFGTALSKIDSYDGVGFGLFGGFCAIDVDHCVVDGELNALALDITQIMGSYWEFSPSGTGIHILFKATGFNFDKTKFYINNQKLGLEIYVCGSTKKYLTLTGNAPDGSLDIEERGAELQIILDKYMRRESKPTEARQAPSVVTELDDRQILEKAHAAKNGALFGQLWNGDISGYDSQSEADLALCNLLYFWAGGDAMQIDRLFRQSGLMRSDKWDRKQSGSTYGEITITKAICNGDNVYSPHSTKRQENTAMQTTNSQISYRPGDFSDAGNARLAEVLFRGRVFFCTTCGWHAWDGKVFRESDARVVALAEDMTFKMLLEAKSSVKAAYIAQGEAKAGDDVEAQEKASNAVKAANNFLHHAQSSRATNRINAMLSLLKAFLDVAPDKLNADAHLLNTPAGIVDLRDGSIIPHDPKYYCTKITQCSPGIGGKKLWDEFLNTITCGDESLKSFLQLSMGMAAYGAVFEESVLIHIGGGANGKSTFDNTCAASLGDYSGTISASSLTTAARSTGAELAALKGVRLAIAAEMESGVRLSDSMLKQLASTDRVHAERKYRDPESFVPSHTVVLFTNNLPRVGGTDDGVWRRIKVVPFKAVIPKDKRDKTLANRLLTEAGEAVMGWIVEGAVNFYLNNYTLDVPEIVREAVIDYHNQSDWLQIFIDEHCVVLEKVSCGSGALYANYRQFATERGDYVRRSDEFVNELERRGFVRKPTNKGKIFFGISLHYSNE